MHFASFSLPTYVYHFIHLPCPENLGIDCWVCGRERESKERNAICVCVCVCTEVVICVDGDGVHILGERGSG